MNDKFHHIIQKLIAEHQPESKEDLQKLLDTLVGKRIDDIVLPEREKTKAEQAQELVWAAYELSIDKGRRRANKALKLDPDCITAYEYLGNTYSYYHKRGPYFEKGVEIGRRIFGGAFLEANKGHFWGITETRPFMRCLDLMAECLYAPGQTDRAIEVWKEMIELNPNDNQGVRYNLLPALLERKDIATYELYRAKYADEASCFVFFSDALKLFMKHGDTAEARKTLKQAMMSNEYVVPLLKETYPPEEYPDSYMWHSREEAIIYVKTAWRAWRSNEGARVWLRTA